MALRRQYFSNPSEPPKKIPGHFCTAKVWLPSWASSVSMFCCSTRIAVITTMIENTPTSTPSTVRPDRSLCVRNACSAMRKLSVISAAYMGVVFPAEREFGSFVAQRVHRLRPRRPPGREKAGGDPGKGGDGQGDGC